MNEHGAVGFLPPDPDLKNLLRALLSAMQRLDGSVRELTQRIAWLRPKSEERRTDPVVAPAAVMPETRTEPPKRDWPPRSKAKIATVGRGARATVIPCGPKAVAAMKGLREKLGLSQHEMAARMGVTNAVIGFIETERQGISRRVYEGMERLKAGRT